MAEKEWKEIIHSDDVESVSSWDMPHIVKNDKLSLKEQLLSPDEVKKLSEKKQQQLARVFEQAKKRGYEQGEKQGYEKGYASLQERSQSLEKLFSAFEVGVTGLNFAFEKEVVDLALAIAKAVIRTEIKTSPEVIKAIVQEALNYLPSNASGINVHMNPSDVDIVENLVAENLMKRLDNIKLKSDENIHPGGCIIKSEMSHVDATIETRLKDVLDKIDQGDKASL